MPWCENQELFKAFLWYYKEKVEEEENLSAVIKFSLTTVLRGQPFHYLYTKKLMLREAQ